MGICGSSDKDDNIIPVNPRREKEIALNQERKVTFTPPVKKAPKSPKETIKIIKYDRKELTKSTEPKPSTFHRSRKTHKTVAISEQQKKELKKMMFTAQSTNAKIDIVEDNNCISNDNNLIEKAISTFNNENAIIANPPEKFQRRNKKSTTLVEKCKLGFKLFKEEFKLCVTNQTLIEETTGMPTAKYKILSGIGDGSFGTVYLAENLLTKQNVAMKKIEKLKENEIDDLELKNEIDILKKLDHPNIVKIFEFYNTPTTYFIITEYCKGGELYGYLNIQYSEHQLAVLFYQVFSGLCYLHENNIIHRDLKLENILVSEIEKNQKSNENYFVIKIIDFGTAKIQRKNKAEKAIVGSSYYIAPEVLKKKYNEKCDTWSIGVILYMLIVGRAPFEGKNDDEIMANIIKGSYDKTHKKLLACSHEVQNLVCCLLNINVEERLSSNQALDHPWFKVFNGRFLYSNFDKNDVLPIINNLFNYKFQSKFQQLVLAFLVHNIPHSSEAKLILKLFRYFNIKGDCKLTRTELEEGLCAFKPKNEVSEYIEDIFLLLDGDNNEFLEYEEFMRACINKKKILNDANLLYAFNFLDKNNTKTISVDNLKEAFVAQNNLIYEEIFKNTLKEVDRNNDGEITLNEFKELMLNIT